MEIGIARRVLSWQEIGDLVEILADQLPSDYDALLAITRGGMIPACLLSERLDLRNIMVAAVQFYTSIGETLDQPRFFQFPSPELLAGQRILVVDDVWDSGRTVVAVHDRIRAAGGHPEIAVLHYKPANSHFPGERPDYVAAETDEWIVYPWEPDCESLG
ncbi:MAG: phosphoribosyltransferase family protein [Sphaerobacter sp.]|nr:phosphoribosyltransferase family protein [Sphaerobacter sp.]